MLVVCSRRGANLFVVLNYTLHDYPRKVLFEAFVDPFLAHAGNANHISFILQRGCLEPGGPFLRRPLTLDGRDWNTVSHDVGTSLFDSVMEIRASDHSLVEELLDPLEGELDARRLAKVIDR